MPILQLLRSLRFQVPSFKFFPEAGPYRPFKTGFRRDACRGDGVSTTRVSGWVKYSTPVDRETHLLTQVVLTSRLKMRVPFSFRRSTLGFEGTTAIDELET